jgi:hypothetical protein
LLVAGDSDIARAATELRVRELLRRPTLDDVRDARPGSTVIAADPDGRVRLTFRLETSDNLLHWHPEPQATPPQTVVDYVLPPGKRFFRFAAE